VSLDTPATALVVLALNPTAGTVGFPSSGSITVSGTPVLAGETVSYLGLTLTAVAAARTPGSNDFNGTGTTAAIAADILAAILDPLNAWATTVTATLSGLTVSMTTIAVGYNTASALVSSSANMTTFGLTGGEVLLDSMLATAVRMVNVDCFGEKTCDATAYLALHFMSTVTLGIAGGGSPLTSRRIGEIAESFAIATPTDPSYGSTQWGRMYLMICESVFCNGTTGASLCLGIA